MTNVLRGSMSSSVLVFVGGLSGCAGTNPRWDGPRDETVARDTDAESSTSDTSVETDDSTASDPSTTEDAETTASDDGPTTGDPPIECPGMRMLCDGVCRDTNKDETACGEACIDCTALYGMADGECRMGECRDKHPDDDDDGPGDDG